jgi:hypothetical protein
VFTIARTPVPPTALLRTYGGRSPDRWRGYQDCFRIQIDHEVSLSEFVMAFYGTPLFKLERLALRSLLGIRSSDADARALVDGTRTTFAAWYEGARTPSELLMCDRYERTRSWFMAKPIAGGGSELCFGSAVATRPGNGHRPSRFGLLLGFHVLYSQLLLAAAVKRLARSRDSSR